MNSMHCHVISRKEQCCQTLFGVMLLFFTLCFFNNPFPYCAAQETTPKPSILKDGSALDISLLDYDSNTLAGKVLDVSTILSPSTSVTVNIDQIPPSIKFIVIQAHAFLYNVTLSYNKVLSQNTFVSGTNIGLIQLTKNQNNAIFFLANAELSTNVSVLVAVQGYGRDAPIPGGCNMESSVEIAPYLGVGYNASVVWVDIPPPAPPSPGTKACERQQAEVEIYHMYLPEKDFSSETYFEALRSMMTVQDVRNNGKKVEFALEGPRSRRVFSSYTGTGSVYGVITIAGFSGAAYVPALTYSCDVVSGTDGCEVLNSTFSKILCAYTLFMGLFVCFFGHRFFKTTLFVLGSLAGGLVSYILFALQESAEYNDTMLYSVLTGLAVATVWSIFWCCCGIPVLSILPAVLTLGYVVAAIAMYSGVADYQIFEIDFNYWMLFVCIALSVAILLVSDSHTASIVCCGVLGAYVVVVPIDHYIGSNLKFILLNTIRRATVKHFGMAALDPPFQTKDTILCAVWFGLASLGIVFQFTQARGKPPFPAPGCCRIRSVNTPRSFPRPATSDRTPLMAGASTSNQHYGSNTTYNVENDPWFFPTNNVENDPHFFPILPKFPPTAPALA